MKYNIYANLIVYGVRASSLSQEQISHITNHKLSIKDMVVSDINEERIVNVSIYDTKGICEDENLGNKHSDTKVSVGEVY